MSRRARRSLSAGFFLVLLLLAGAGYRVGRSAQQAILESESGLISEVTLDPSAPGFRAFTEPTPVALVVHTGTTTTGAQLLSVTMLAGAAGNSGGTVVSIPAGFANTDGTGRPLEEIFAQDGLSAVTAEVRNALGIGFAELIVLDASSWTSLMQADLPLQLSLRDDLVDLDDDGAEQVVVAGGTREFTLIEVAQFAAHRNPGEPSLPVALRHQQIWRSWISRTAAASERPALFDVDSKFIDLVDGLASGEVGYRTIPADAVSADLPENTLYAGRGSEIDDLVSSVVPFPLPAEAGERPGVLLLDSTFGASDSAPVLQAIVRSGGRVTILGNTEAGSTALSEVQLHDEAALDVAEAIAQRLGVPQPRLVPLVDPAAPVTVIVGADLTLPQ